MSEIVIADRRIALDEPPYFVAEIGHNPAGNVMLALDMAKAAKKAGASAVKFQTRTPRDVYQMKNVRGGYLFESDNPHWMNRVYGKHREELEFSPGAWRELFIGCREIGITAFSTPFDHKSADLLISLDVPAFKIASGDATNLPLIKHVAETKKPVIVSTGGCSLTDVQRVYDEIMPVNNQLALLQCTCVYPAPPETLNLLALGTYRKRFQEVIVGLSSHCPDWIPNIAAWMLGARIFENHFTTDRTLKGTDNAFSLTPDMLRAEIEALRVTALAVGKPGKAPEEVEINPTLERRKKMVWTRDMKRGDVVKLSDLIAKCPGDGIPPYRVSELVGMELTADVAAEETVEWLHLSKMPIPVSA